VISDLHLGGREGFEMCTPDGRQRLAKFIGYVAGQCTAQRDVRLVINGDVVDFLAEADKEGNYVGFTDDQTLALTKLEHVFERSQAVWQALRELGAAGGALTLLLGNHDVELSLPAVRQRLLAELGRGRVELIYDNQAWRYGDLLIEHGNRYDAWNVVPHDTLRRIRSQLSRGAPPPAYPVQPGSLLVIDVMNRIKQMYPWVDLLKPETEGLLKLLRVFGAVAPLDAIKSLRQATRMAERWLQYDADGLPTDQEYVNYQSLTKGHGSFDEELVATATAPGAKDELDDLARAVKVELQLPDVLKAFRHRAAKDATTFHIDTESATYLKPAKALTGGEGPRVVVFGHTHLAKSLDLGNGALYLNTGTWADLIRVPESAYTGSDEKALADLKPFVEALRTNDIAGLRRQVATYARIDLNDKAELQQAGAYFYDGPAQVDVPLSTAGMLQRLEAEV
jgi:UDP-2,3-diacylglucosamine pyrophosphatase LpxH